MNPIEHPPAFLANHFLSLFYGKKCLVVKSDGRHEPTDGLNVAAAGREKWQKPQNPLKMVKNEAFCAPNDLADGPNEPSAGPYEPSDRPNDVEVAIFEQHDGPNEPPEAPNELTETPYEPADRPETPED
jgi:hypothetical protein